MPLKGNTVFHYILISFLFPNYLFGHQEFFFFLNDEKVEEFLALDNTKRSGELLF